MALQQGSPFQQMDNKQGPQITPKTMGAAGQGGNQQPGYLQMRAPTGPAGGATQPVVTPKPGVMGDSVNPKPVSTTTMNMQPGSIPGQPPITPAGTNPPQQGGTTLGDVYSFFKSDLQNEAKQKTSNSIADASARGVYYGTPLTGSEADINTQYLRGLGQLQSGMYGNEQSNQLARLGMASGLLNSASVNAPPAPGPLDLSGLGALFASNNPANPNVNGPRNGPVITPQTADKVSKTNTKTY